MKSLKNLLENDVYLALIHYPVVNKKGDSIASALTTIDMHDIARAGKTFGVKGIFIVTPLEDQKILAKEVIDHWVSGVGGQINPFRKQALELISITDSFDEAVERITKENGKPVISVATSAAGHKGAVSAESFSQTIDNKFSYLITFGTAWGLSNDFIESCSNVLEPVKGVAGYNHLSVRSAVSILLDRICRAE